MLDVRSTYSSPQCYPQGCAPQLNKATASNGVLTIVTAAMRHRVTKSWRLGISSARIVYRDQVATGPNQKSRDYHERPRIDHALVGHLG